MEHMPLQSISQQPRLFGFTFDSLSLPAAPERRIWAAGFCHSIQQTSHTPVVSVKHTHGFSTGPQAKLLIRYARIYDFKTLGLILILDTSS